MTFKFASILTAAALVAAPAFADGHASGDAEASDAAFRLAAKRLDQAAAKNLIHKNKASRTKSRLSQIQPSRKLAE